MFIRRNGNQRVGRIGYIFTRMKFLGMESVPFDLIIRDAIQIKLRVKIDKREWTVINA